MHLPKSLISLIIITAFSFLVFISPKQVLASIAPVFYNTAPPPGSVEVIPPTPCQLPAFCSNTATPGQANQCGSTCPPDGTGYSGASWTEYSLKCFLNTTFNTYTGDYQVDGPVYSTADKCSDGSNNPPPESYLRSGSCSGGIGGIYKTCCTNTTHSLVTTNSCVPITPSSGAPTPPMDGVCPGGTYWVMCGVSQATCNDVIANGGRCTTAACGQAACGPVSPVVTVTCTQGTSYNQCGQTPPPGTCLYNYPANHTVSVTPSSCTDGTTPNSCSDLGVYAGQCGNPYPPTIPPNGFTVSCNQTAYNAGLSWSGKPFDTGTCGTGFWVDIDNDNNWDNGYSHKCVTKGALGVDDSYSITTDGSDFGPSFNFNQGSTYYARVFNNSPDNFGHSNTVPVKVPDAACTVLTTISGKVTSCSSGAAAIPGAVISIYDDGLKQTQTFTTDSSGNFTSSFVRSGDAYAVNPPASAPSDYQNPPSPASYQKQVAGGNPSCGTNCSFCYTPKDIFNYDLSCSDATVTRGENGTSTITVNKLSTVTQQVNLSAVSPSGPDVSVNPSSCTPNTSCTSTINIQTTSSTAPGLYTMTVTGDSTGLASKSNACQLTIQPPLATDCSITGFSLNPVTYNNTSKSWNNTQINWNTTNYGASHLYYYNAGTCSGLSGSNRCPADGSGWTLIQGADAATDGSWGFPWNPNSFSPAPNSTHTIGVTDSNHLFHGCVRDISFGTPAPAPPPAPSGNTCTGPNELCTSSAWCPISSSPAQNVWCQTYHGSNTACQICPPPPPPSSSSCQYPYQALNDAPTAVLQPDGHNVKITYQISGDSTPTPAVTLWRSNQYGFIGTGTKLGTQFGGYGMYWQYPGNDQMTPYYYQLQTQSGTQSSLSNTAGVIALAQNSRACGVNIQYEPRLISAAQVPNTATATTVTFNLTYQSTSWDGSYQAPTNLQLTNTAGNVSYIPWVKPPLSSRTCYSGYYNDCRIYRFTARYTIDLPPNTTNTYTLTGFGIPCYGGGTLGNVSAQLSTIDGIAPGVKIPTLSASSALDGTGNAYVAISWPQIQQGEQVNVYQSTTRWPQDVQIPAAKSGNPPVFTGYDDLTNQPSGTYYYGAVASQNPAYCNLPTDQTAFTWAGITLPWIQTTNGDVHSNTSINTQGGP